MDKNFSQFTKFSEVMSEGWDKEYFLETLYLSISVTACIVILLLIIYQIYRYFFSNVRFLEKFYKLPNNENLENYFMRLKLKDTTVNDIFLLFSYNKAIVIKWHINRVVNSRSSTFPKEKYIKQIKDYDKALKENLKKLRETYSLKTEKSFLKYCNTLYKYSINFKNFIEYLSYGDACKLYNILHNFENLSSKSLSFIDKINSEDNINLLKDYIDKLHRES